MPRQKFDLEGVLVIGKARIRYRLRRSEQAKRQRIVVEPGSVEVVLPRGVRTADGHRFIEEKRRWVFDKVERFAGRTERKRSYRAGSKIRFRGRWLTLEVKAGRRKTGSVAYRSRFWVTTPRGTEKSDRPREAKRLLHDWMTRRLLADGKRDGRRYAERLDLDIAGVEVVPMKRMWASCGKDRIIRLNRELIEFPRAVLEYVVAHEVCHLLHRNHSSAFWNEVGQIMPDWRERQDWLSSYERDWGL